MQSFDFTFSKLSNEPVCEENSLCLSQQRAEGRRGWGYQAAVTRAEERRCHHASSFDSTLQAQAWYREGEAARLLELYEDAAQAFYEAYALDPTNSMVAKDFQDAVARGREQHAARQAGGS